MSFLLSDWLKFYTEQYHERVLNAFMGMNFHYSKSCSNTKKVGHVLGRDLFSKESGSNHSIWKKGQRKLDDKMRIIGYSGGKK